MDIPTSEEILNTLFSTMQSDERTILCSVAGDPSTVERWSGIPWRLGGRYPLSPIRNNYTCISTFTADERGAYRRKKDTFRAMHVIMVDDIGTKIDARTLPPELRPTLILETSPGNYQATFKLAEPITDVDLAGDLIKRMIEVLAPDGIDPGMSGVTRVMRLPDGINGKSKYIRDGQLWRVRVARWAPDVVMTFDQLAHAFSLVRQVRTFHEPGDAVTVERKRGFEIVLAAAKELGIVKRQGRGWIDVVCPWVHEHTDKASTGSAIAYPAQINGWFGGYRCHHGHCQGRGWGDLEDWVGRKAVLRGQAMRGPFRGAV